MQDAQITMSSVDGLDDGRNAWSDEGRDNTHLRMPIPESLRAGPPGGLPNSSQDLPRLQTNTNPYLKKQAQAGETNGDENSTNSWGSSTEQATQPQPSRAPPIPSSFNHAESTSQQFTSLSISEPSTNPWQPALDEVATSRKSSRPPSPPPNAQVPEDNIWSQPPPSRPALIAPEQEDLIDLEDDPESPAWDEDDESTSDHEPPPKGPEKQPQALAESNVWDDTRGKQIDHDAIDTNKFLASDIQAHQVDGWSLVERVPVSEGEQARIAKGEGNDPSTQLPIIATTAAVLSPSAAEAAEKQKKETYEIKKITWHDATAAKNPRTSPILVQNANGPCPLLALVNALTLSTPADVETALVDTLRSREQVSLGLLLDAVLDELMSGRRGDAAQELPDVSDLYYFLITLHTGMNVNPRFFPAPPTKSSSDPRNSMSHVHPAEREETIPGTFEDTREMKLYSTFSVPLIHGWLPAIDSPAYTALKRSAASYEDAQNLMFHEEGLEEKLKRDGLSFEEQATLEDISTIKAFFHAAATQITAHGLETITTSLAPGAVAILFRNDHFSTLYRHPDTLQLLQLVTDMGYSGHEEVVWESLMDVNGENTEFFSGDFRLVGGAPASPAQSYSQTSSQSNAQWITVEGRNQSRRRSTRTPSPHHRNSQTPQSPITEQEDHDLALALQLQEEEEERHRDEVERRRREAELSQQYIEQQGSQQNSVPVTIRGGTRGGMRGGTRGGGRGSGRGSYGIRQPAHPSPGRRPSPGRSPGRNPNLPPRPEQRPAIPPRSGGPGGQPIGGQPVDPEAGVDAPPPSYEQAATEAPYVPSDSSTAGQGQNIGSSEAGGTSQGPGSYRSNGSTRRKPVGSQASPQKPQERERDCTVM